MLWQEDHPEIKPHSSFPSIKNRVFNRIDQLFDRFLGGDLSKPENMKIRLEEIAWGGVVVDGIPSLDNPKLIDANEASYLIDSDLVFGVAINGDVRAYPLRIMGWHEMFNETIGGVPVALAYCTLSGVAKAWPIAAFKDKAVVNDKVGTLNVVLIGDASSRTVRAYARGDLKFAKSDKTDQLSSGGEN